MMVGFGDGIDLTVGISYADGKAALIEEHAGRMGWPSRLKAAIQNPALHTRS